MEGVEGCQNGVGVGVDIRAMEQVEPPLKGLRDAGGLEGEELVGWGDMSEVFIGRSAAMGSESDLRWRSWFWMKVKSAVRKAWVRMVEIVGWGMSGEKAEGWKRRK